MRLLIAALALLSALLGGCAAVPMASVEADTTAKQFQPRPGMSNIYLYRNETFGAAIAMTVSLNGKVMGRSGPKTYFLWEVPPGKYEIVSHTENVRQDHDRGPAEPQPLRLAGSEDGDVHARLAPGGDERGGRQEGRAGVHPRHPRRLTL